MALCFSVLSEAQLWKRFLTVEDRLVQYPDGRTNAFDILGSPKIDYKFVCTFVYFSSRNSCILLREFAQAALPQTELVYNLPGGGFLPKKHKSVQHAAQDELSEEAQLKGGSWVRLLPEEHPGVLETKWCRNRLTPFLCIDPEQDPTPRAQEATEYIQRTEVSIPELRAAMLSGEMLLPALHTCMAALEWLAANGKLRDGGSPGFAPKASGPLRGTLVGGVAVVLAIGVARLLFSQRAAM